MQCLRRKQRAWWAPSWGRSDTTAALEAVAAQDSPPCRGLHHGSSPAHWEKQHMLTHRGLVIKDVMVERGLQPQELGRVGAPNSHATQLAAPWGNIERPREGDYKKV